MVVKDAREIIFFLSCLNGAMNYTCDVWQFQRSFCNPRTLQFVTKMAKNHLVLCETAQWTTSCLICTSPTPARLLGWHRKSTIYYSMIQFDFTIRCFLILRCTLLYLIRSKAPISMITVLTGTFPRVRVKPLPLGWVRGAHRFVAYG